MTATWLLQQAIYGFGMVHYGITLGILLDRRVQQVHKVLLAQPAQSVFKVLLAQPAHLAQLAQQVKHLKFLATMPTMQRLPLHTQQAQRAKDTLLAKEIFTSGRHHR
jgi:hypothetical protein